jgi:DNA-binding NarL/FixJ family response regulator
MPRPGPPRWYTGTGAPTGFVTEPDQGEPVSDTETRRSSEPIRVLIADDQALFRRGLYVVLGTEEGIEVVAEAGNGEEAVAKAEEFAPDVVLMDVRMPKLNGIDAARTIRSIAPSTKILMLTVSDEEDDLYEAIKAGANGYLLKEISVEEVADAIRAVVQGQSLISPSMASKLLSEFNSLVKRAEEKQQIPAPALTSRELEVLRLVAKGMSNRDIADELYISENTVKNHVRNILEKLHLHSRMQAVMYAVRERLIDTEAE